MFFRSDLKWEVVEPLRDMGNMTFLLQIVTEAITGFMYMFIPVHFYYCTSDKRLCWCLTSIYHWYTPPGELPHPMLWTHTDTGVSQQVLKIIVSMDVVDVNLQELMMEPPEMNKTRSDINTLIFLVPWLFLNDFNVSPSGWRIRKKYFLVKNKEQPKERYLLSWVSPTGTTPGEMLGA